MSSSDDHAQHARVQDRFTRTAQQFAKFSLSTRSAEAEHLVRLARPHLPQPKTALALDIACGPGTFTLAFAAHVQKIVGLDLTPALLAQARAAAVQGALSNVSFTCGDAASLPFATASADLASCAYALHHIPDPAGAIAEMSRVVRPGGFLALVDLFVPSDPAQAELSNRIERARDSSHTRTLSIPELRSLVESSGFRILTSETGERPRSFDDWMQIAGWSRSHGTADPAYIETRRLMESAIPGDAAGFRAAFSAGPGSDISWVQTSLFLIACA